EDELLRLVMVVVGEMGHHLANDVQVDLLPARIRGWNRSYCMCLIGLMHSALLPVAPQAETRRGSAHVANCFPGKYTSGDGRSRTRDPATGNTTGRHKSRPVSLACWNGSGAEKRLEVAVELLQEEMHVDHISRVNARTIDRSLWLDPVFLGLLVALAMDDRFLGQPPERELRLLRVCVIEDRGHEIPGVAVLALDQHRPDIRLAGNDLDVVGAVFAMADDAAVHVSKDDLLDIDVWIHDFLL